MLPKLSVKDYPEMLAKLAWFFFLSCTTCLFFIRYYVPEVDAVFRKLAEPLPEDLEVLGLTPVDAIPVILGTLFAFFSHLIRWHDKLSDLLGIRRRFDVQNILIPTALLSGSSFDESKLERLPGARNTLMADIFYSYASSGEGDTRVVSNHTLKESLTTWSWFWVCLEALSVMVPTSLLIVWSNPYLSTGLLVFSLLLLFAMYLLQGESRKYALKQVYDIVRDQTRRTEIQSRFSQF